MVSLVMYRDLPGGPKQIKFADEISRHSLCGKCRMFSMTMYRDPNGHVFCEDCLKAQSEEHGKDYIYCEYEKADVGIHEMYEDHDLVTMLRDQFVECPNKEKCMMDLNLHRLKTHYISCQPIVKCSSCGDDVQSTEWEAHKYSCARRNAAGATSKKASSVQQDARKPHPASASSPDAPISKSGEDFQDKSTSVRDLPTREKFGEAIKSTPLVPQSQHIVSDKKDACLPNKTTRPGASHNESKEKCPHCGRTVKSSNFNVHLTRCPKLPVTCTYCQEDFEKTDIKIHEEGCKSNPQNQAKELQRSQPKRPRTPPPKVMDTESEEHESKDRRRGSSYADAVKGLIFGSSASQSKEAQTGTQPQREDGNTRQPSKEERKRKPPTSTDMKSASLEISSSSLRRDGDAWLAYMAIGDWFTAFIVMEEWFHANHISNQEKYARLATGLDTLKLDIFVPDFMNDPSKKSPYECLLIAILARFCLSKHLRARRETITWDTVFEYTPPVLKKRLQKTDNSYLKKHKVFIRCIGSTEVDEVGEDAAKGEPPIGHPSSTESGIHKAESRLNHETACEKSPPDGQDTPKLTDQNMNKRKPEGDHKQSRRGNLKFTLLESCNFKPGRSSEERGSESDCTDMKMAEGTLGPEPCQEAGGTPSQETVRTENVLNSEAGGSSSLTDLTTKKQEAESDEELSQCAAIGRFLAEALHLTPSKTSEERGKDVEMQELFEDGKTLKTAYETASQGSVAANSGPSSESIEIQKPEEEIGNLKPVYAHVTLQEECSLNSAVTSCDKWPVVEKNDMKMSNGKGDPERRSKASTAPCQESVTTKNGLNGKAGSSSLSTLDTEEENPHAEKKLPESTSLEGICSAALPLKKGERFSEKEAAESAKPRVSDDPNSFTATCDAPSQKAVATSRGHVNEVCCSSCNLQYCTHTSFFCSPERGVDKLTALPEQNITITEMSEKTCSEQVEEQNSSAESSVADCLHPYVSGMVPILKHGRPEQASRGRMPESECFPVVSSSEQKVDLLSCDECTTESRALLAPSQHTDTNKVRLKWCRELLMSPPAEESISLPVPSEAHRCGNRARPQAADSEPCHHETSDALCEQSPKCFRKDDATSSVVQMTDKKQGDIDRVHFNQQASLGSTTETSQVSQNHREKMSSEAGERNSHSAYKKSKHQHYKREACCPSSGRTGTKTSVCRAVNTSRKEVSSCLDNEVAHSEQKMPETDRKAVFSREKQGSGYQDHVDGGLFTQQRCRTSQFRASELYRNGLKFSSTVASERNSYRHFRKSEYRLHEHEARHPSPERTGSTSVRTAEKLSGKERPSCLESEVIKYDQNRAETNLRAVHSTEQQESGKQDQADEVSFTYQEDHGSSVETSELFKKQPNLDSLRTGERDSHRDCQVPNYPYHEHKAGYLSAGANRNTKITRTAGKSHGIEWSLPPGNELPEYVHHRKEAHFKEAPPSEKPNSEGNSDKAFSSRPVLEAQLGGSDFSTVTSEQVVRSVPATCSAQAFLNLGKGAVEAAEVRSASSDDLLASRKCDLCSKEEQCFQNTTHESRQNNTQADTVKTHPSKVQAMPAKARTGAVSMGNAYIAGCIRESDASQLSQESGNNFESSEGSAGRYQINYDCAQPLTICRVHSNFPYEETFAYGSECDAQSEGMPEDGSEKTNIQAIGDSCKEELFPEQESQV